MPVTCDEPDGVSLTTETPVAIYEVLSDSTAHHDASITLREYVAMPSVQP